MKIRLKNFKHLFQFGSISQHYKYYMQTGALLVILEMFNLGGNLDKVPHFHTEERNITELLGLYTAIQWDGLALCALRTR